MQRRRRNHRTSSGGKVVWEGIKVLSNLLLGIIDELPCLHLDNHLTTFEGPYKFSQGEAHRSTAVDDS